MTRLNKLGAIRRSTAALWVGLAFVMMSLGSCESIFGPKTSESSDDTSEEARIVCTNSYGASLDFYLDGKYQFTVGDTDVSRVHNLSLVEHTMQAKLPGTSTVVDKETIDVVAYTDYSYVVGPPPSINVTNKYGVTLKVYMDGQYQFDILDEENRWIMNVTKTDHYMRAVKAGDLKEVASTTVAVDEDKNKNYAWNIL